MDQSDLPSTTEEPDKSDSDEPLYMKVDLKEPLWYKILLVIHRLL